MVRDPSSFVPNKHIMLSSVWCGKDRFAKHCLMSAPSWSNATSGNSEINLKATSSPPMAVVFLKLTTALQISVAPTLVPFANSSALSERFAQISRKQSAVFRRSGWSARQVFVQGFTWCAATARGSVIYSLGCPFVSFSMTSLKGGKALSIAVSLCAGPAPPWRFFESSFA